MNNVRRSVSQDVLSEELRNNGSYSWKSPVAAGVNISDEDPCLPEQLPAILEEKVTCIAAIMFPNHRGLQSIVPSGTLGNNDNHFQTEASGPASNGSLNGIVLDNVGNVCFTSFGCIPTFKRRLETV